MSYLFWNPLSITLLIETILNWLVAGFFFQQFLSVWRSGQPYRNPLFLLISFGSAAIGVTLQLLANTLSTGLANYPLAWVSPPAAIGMTGFILFSYYFQKTESSKWGSTVLVAVLSVVIAIECYIAIARLGLLGIGIVEYREAWLDFPFVLCFLFAYFFFFRSLVTAIALETGQSKIRSILPALVAVVWLPKSLPRKATAARAFLYVTLVPLMQGLTSLTRSYGLIDWRLAELLIGWLYLFFLASFTLVYLNFMPERSSFRVKLVGATLTAVLMILVGISWIIGPVYIDAYKNGNQIEQLSAYRFEPNPDGTYLITPTHFSFDTDLGKRVPGPNMQVDLPFSFPFFDGSYSALFTKPAGMIGFQHVPVWRDVLHKYGPQPAIFVAATALSRRTELGELSGIFVKLDAQSVIVTWNRLVASHAPEDYYTFQLKLYATGAIEMMFLELPKKPAYDIYRIGTAPVLTGLVPNWDGRQVVPFSFSSDLPLTLEAGQGAIDDHRRGFLIYLDRIYEPIALFILLSSLGVLIIFPYFFTINLHRPLKNLLGGVQEILRGRLTSSIRVSYRDEIGYLASSFNEMAKAQHDLIQTLEDKVVARTAEASLYAEKSARLEERNRLSQELHDAVSQTLFSANLIADTLPDQWDADPSKAQIALQEVRALNKNALVEMRNLLLELRSNKLTNSTFAQLLAELIAEMQAKSSLEIVLTAESDPKLPDEVQHAFYRVAQECLSNAIKHAKADKVQVYFDGMKGQAILSVTDNGYGFEPEEKSKNSFGLQIMEERMIKIGGRLEIETVRGLGTRIVAIWMGTDG